MIWILGRIRFVHCRIPRTKSSAGVKTISIPWADLSSRTTYAFDHLAIDLLKATKNQTQTAQLLRCGFDVINRLLHHSVVRGLKRRKLGEIHHVSLDEKSYQRGHKYMTVLGDGILGIVLDVSEGRDLNSAQTVFERTLRGKTAAVKTVTTDMWKSYIRVATTLLSGATLIHDRFHLIQYLNKAIDQVRRREVKTHEALKGSRYVLLKNEKNRTEKQNEIFKAIQASNVQVSIAWRLREEFKAIFGGDSYAEASTYFKLWLESVKNTAVQEVIEIAEMFGRHYEGVCNALCHGIRPRIHIIADSQALYTQYLQRIAQQKIGLSYGYVSRTIQCQGRTTQRKNPESQNRWERIQKIRELQICYPLLLRRIRSLSTTMPVEPDKDCFF